MREAVVERQDDQHGPALAYLDHRAALLDIGRVVAMGEQDALRVGGGAGGIADVGVIVRAHGSYALLKFRSTVLDELLSHSVYVLEVHLIVLQLDVVDHYDLLDRRAPVDDPAHLGNLALGRYHEAGIRMVDAEEQVLVGLKLERKRHIDSAGVENSELTENPLVAAF